MPRRSHAARFALGFALILLAAACGKEDKPTGPSGVVPDFSLVDVNPNSPSSSRNVSPRQELHNISAWYFGHAT